MKPDSYKHACPRTLLADVLALLMRQRGIDFAALERLSGVNRGTIHKIAAAGRSCEPDMRQILLAHLVSGDGHAQLLSDMFDGDSEGLLTIPEFISTLELSLAPTRRRAVQDGLDIGALCGNYGLIEMYSDALAMEQAGKWPIACRWASYMVTVARRRGELSTELYSRLFHARLLMASSRFAESCHALEHVYNYALPVPADCMAGDHSAWIRIHAGVYLGWLNYEIGDYTSALRYLDSAIAWICALSPVGCGKGPNPSDISLDLLCAVKSLDAKDKRFAYAAPLDLLNLALHLRGKVLAERAMYVPAYMNNHDILAARRALIKSAAVAGFLGGRGTMGHCLLWMARLAAVRAAHVEIDASTPPMSVEDDRILRAAEMPARKVLLKCLEAGYEPKRLLSLASHACFGDFQSSELNRGYYQRARAVVRALEGDFTGAFSGFEDACDLFTHYAPDARGLGPLLYERYLLESRCDRGVARGMDWLVAAVAVHPSRFLAAALCKKCIAVSKDRGVKLLHDSAGRVLAFQKPFAHLQRLGLSLWGREAASVMQRNIQTCEDGTREVYTPCVT